MALLGTHHILHVSGLRVKREKNNMEGLSCVAEELLICYGGLCVKESASPQRRHVTRLRTCHILRCSDSHRIESGQLYAQSTINKMRRFSIYLFL